MEDRGINSIVFGSATETGNRYAPMKTCLSLVVASKYSANRGIPMPYFTSGQPTIICVQPNGESDDHHGNIELLIKECGHDGGHEYFGVSARGKQGDWFIMLCPRF